MLNSQQSPSIPESPLEDIETDEEITQEEEQKIEHRLSQYIRQPVELKFRDVPNLKTQLIRRKQFKSFKECLLINSQSFVSKQAYIYIKQKVMKFYEEIMKQGQELMMIFSLHDNYINRISKLIKMCAIGLMQIQQFVELFLKKDQQFNFRSRQETLGKYSLIGNDPLNVNLKHTISFLNYMSIEILEPLFKNNEEFFAKTVIRSPNSILNSCKIFYSKLVQMIELFPNVLIRDQRDLFSLDESSEEWIYLRSQVQFKVIDTREKILASYNQVLRGILLGNAIVSKQGEYDNEIMKGMVMGFGALYYMINDKKADKKARTFQAEPEVKSALKVWNMLDDSVAKHLLPMIFPSIKYKENIYIPRFFKPINIEYILEQYANGTFNKKNENNDCGDYIQKPLMTSHKDLFEKKFLKQGRVQVRLLCGKKIQINKNPLQFEKQIDKEKKKQTEIFESIIIHVHGGGFVSMSSRSHQCYTRKWATNLNVPIFSIDYRLSPAHPFPAALDDIWQAYNWIINFTPYYFNIIPKRVVLVGDSAGGNLIASLTLLAIKERIRVPDGLLMAYPALNLSLTEYTPSMLISLKDGLLPHTFLKMCMESYIQNKNLRPQEDPLLSPSKASDELLDEFPPSWILAGDNDPLHDESWRFLQRLKLRGRTIRMILYEGMPHGFLSFDTPQGMKESAVTVNDAQQLLDELLQQK